MENTQNKKIYSLDYETFYSKEYGIEECGIYGYLHDERFDPYLLSVWGEDIQWVGHPKEFQYWDKLSGQTYIAHNSSYDRQVLERCIELGISPVEARPSSWQCSANMSVALGGPRNLKDAAQYMLGVTLSKEMRFYMRGRTWQDAVNEGKEEQLKQYALDDAKYCYLLWEKYNKDWPEIERKTAELTYVQTKRGIAIDTALLDSKIPGVKTAKEKALSEIPWVGMVDEKGEELKPLSVKALKQWLKKTNIPAPESTEAKNPIFIEWQKKYSDVKAIKAMQTYRSANALTLKAETLRRQIRPDGRYSFNMLYHGSTTGRWSGGYEDDRNDSGGVNLQNLIKEELFGLNLRKAFIAPKGKKFIIADFEQVEPRCLAWLSDDKEFLQVVRQGVPLYEAHARAQGSWTKSGTLKKEDPKLYLQKKAEILALGFGAGWAKFRFMCAMYGAEDCLLAPITDTQKSNFVRYIQRTHQQDKVTEFSTDLDWTKAVNAWNIVSNFRTSKPKITKLWERLERDCWKCTGTNYTVELPSGRLLRYFHVKTLGGLTVQKTLNASPIKVWGGFFTENITQGMARDVMRDAMLNVEDRGITTIFHSHDELIAEVDTNFDSNIMKEVMIQTPEWAEGLPLSVSIEESDFYRK